MKAEIGKYGVKHDYRGAHVVLEHAGQTLLGTIMNVRRDDVLGVFVADVRHFCGDEWPITPRLGALEILERTYESEES